MDDPAPDYVTTHLAIDVAKGGERRWKPDADLTRTQEGPAVPDGELMAELGRDT